VTLKKREVSSLLRLASKALEISEGRVGGVDRTGRSQHDRLRKTLDDLRNATNAVIDDLDRRPTQRSAAGATIPVPTRSEVIGDLEKVAKPKATRNKAADRD